MKPRCTWDAAHGWLTVEHERDCDDHSCRGCKPCPKSHCGMRGRCGNHVDPEAGIITCPRCIGRTRSDIAAVVDLYAIALPEEAEVVGVDSEALNLATPAAPYSVLGDLTDERHPYTLLGGYDLLLRETYGPPTAFGISVATAAKYLTGLLAGPFPHDGQEFEEFAKDVAACRAHLEAVIHDSRAPERGRECPRCIEATGAGPRLRKRYSDGTDARSMAGDHDTWHCPDEPEHWWSERDYRDRVDADYVQHAEALPVREMADRTGVSASTIRRWAGKQRVTKPDGEPDWLPPLIRSVGKSNDGRLTYRVSDVERLAGRTAGDSA